MATYNNLSDGRPDGALLGNDASDPVGFHGVAPSAQRSGAVQAALTLTTATVSGYGFSTASAFDKCIALQEEMRATLVAKGLMAGS